MNPYIGNEKQLSGVQEYRVVGGKGDGMRMLRVRNGKGLDFEISLDRAGDIVTLSLDGVNLSYFAPCGYVHPAYYNQDEFLKSFTAGFFTTCGFNNVGSPCTDNGEDLPLHGTISNVPCESYAVTETDDKIDIVIRVRDCALFGRQFMLERNYMVLKCTNAILLTDKVTNIGASEQPMMILYHCNMGYPLLSENAKVMIPHSDVQPRNEHAASDIANCLTMEKPQAGYEEMCFFFDVLEKDGQARAGIFNPDINKGLVMAYDKSTLGYFTEWKMMGEVEYVLGLEPGNCTPEGRNVMREKGVLNMLAPGEEYETSLAFSFVADEEEFSKKIG